jgi:hypothetical protein
MTRLEACRVAVECITEAAKQLALTIRYNDKSAETVEKRRRYIRLAKALKYFEGQASQKEMEI